MKSKKSIQYFYFWCLGLLLLGYVYNYLIKNKDISEKGMVHYRYAEVSGLKIKEPDSTKFKNNYDRPGNNPDDLPPPPADSSKVEAIPIDSYVPVLLMIAVVLIVLFAKKRNK